ncbi:MAG: O-antigen ligase family protein [Terriglobia bacterium]
MRDAPDPALTPSASDEGATSSAPQSIWSRVVWTGLVVAALLAPLPFGAVQKWAWTALLVVALALLIVWAVGSANNHVVRLYWCPLYVPAALFLVLGAIQFFDHRTLDPFATRESLLNLTANLIYFFLAGQVLACGSGRELPRFGWVVVVYAFLLSLFAVVQFFSGDGLLYWSVQPRWGGAVFGPYVNHNHYAGLMEILIPIGAAYVLSRPQGHPGKALLGFAVLVPTASLLLSGSRGGLISLLVEGLILAVVLLRGSPVSRRQSLVVASTLGIVFAGVLFFWLAPQSVTRRLGSVVDLFYSPEISLGDRFRVSEDSLRIFRDHPWLGTGLGSFEAVFPEYQSFPSDLRYDHAHDDYAEALTETGLVGGALIVLALWLFFRSAFRNLNERLEDEIGWIQIGAALGCCGLLVHSLVDFNLHIPANAVWFAVSFGIATSFSERSRPGRQSPPG